MYFDRTRVCRLLFAAALTAGSLADAKDGPAGINETSCDATLCPSKA
jgi:hypothetical protein